ncbi:MAG: DUF4340 domain-containing protein [Thalassobaculaceae bacterium]|nr:DUF4340 domain-containing protein [Thalassobaculaceae bacterium]
MITQRTVTLLGTLTLLTAIGASVAMVDRLSDVRTEVEAELLYPDFDRRAGEVQQIEVIRADDNEDGTVSIVRTGDGWILQQRDGFPARTDTVRKLLFDIGQLELIERKTADPGRFNRLDLRDVAQEGSKASRLVVTSADGETLVDLHVGKRRDSLSGGEPMVYVRRTDDTQSYLAEGSLEIKGKAPLWLFREVVDVPQADIRRAAIVTADGSRLELERVSDDGRDFRIANLPDSRKIDSQYAVNNAATVLDKLLFDDVRTADGLTFDPDLGHAEYTTADGVLYTVEFAKDPAGGDAAEKPAHWLRVRITVPEGASDEARALAEKHREQTTNWAFRISEWEMERLTATAESLSKPAEAS